MIYLYPFRYVYDDEDDNYEIVEVEEDQEFEIVELDDYNEERPEQVEYVVYFIIIQLNF